MDLLDLNVILELNTDSNFKEFLNNERYFEFYSLLINELQYKKKLDPIFLTEIYLSKTYVENTYSLETNLDIFIDFKLITDLILPIYKEVIKPSLDNILNIIFPSLEKIFIYEDGSCHYYDKTTKLYTYEKKHTLILIKLIGFLRSFKKRLEKMMPLFFGKILIIFKKIENMLTHSDIKKIGNILKQERDIIFNNKSYEIAYKNKILCLKSGRKRPRIIFDYYTDTIQCSYYPDYYSIPSYILSIFGNDKNYLDKVQKILGSCIIGEPNDNIILFYGSGPNSKTTLLNELSDILKTFHLNLDYYTLSADDLKKKMEFKQKRLITMDNIDPKGFVEIEYYINRLLSNRNFNFIGVIDNEMFLKTQRPFLKKHSLIEFNFSFLQNPKGNLEKKKIKNLNINKNFLFTWLCKGSMKYNYEQSLDNKIQPEYNDEEDIYGSSDNIFDPDKEYLNNYEDIKKKIKCQTIYIGSGMLQQKRNYYKIGKTKQDIEKRMKVYQTGRDVDDRFICLAHFACYDCDKVESEIKKILNKIDPNHFNEVYNINYDIIYSIVKELVDKHNKEIENN